MPKNRNNKPSSHKKVKAAAQRHVKHRVQVIANRTNGQFEGMSPGERAREIERLRKLRAKLQL